MSLLTTIEVQPAVEVGPVHFIAIGGSGMNGIARLYAKLGIPTSGSDRSDSATLDSLREAGITCYVGHDASQLGDARTVVISSAIREDNPELAEARRRGLRVWHRSAALAALMLGKSGVSIAGTHGKTTTTAMTAVMLQQAGAEPSYVIGGKLAATKVSSDIGTGDAFVIEADESDGSFLQYPTRIAIITSIEPDHMVNWGTPEAYAEGYHTFATLPTVEWAIVNADDLGARALADRLRAEGRRVISYGFAEDADVRVSDANPVREGITGTLRYGDETGVLRLKVPGNHNLSNASAAYAAGRILGLGHEEALAALGQFTGTLRRLQLITDTAGIRVYDDYAHHPTEIRAALTAARHATEVGNEDTGLDGRLIACFQPHLYSRTADLHEELGEVLTLADIAVINDVCGDREDPIPGVTGQLVVDSARRHGVREVVYVVDKYDLPAALNEISRPGDLIITLGCGDVTIVGPLLAPLLAQRPEAQNR